jgi:protein-S-isoprenylcysteine O-methyltransferase Ste14
MKRYRISPHLLAPLNFGVLIPLGIIFVRPLITAWDYVAIAVGMALGINLIVAHYRIHHLIEAHAAPGEVARLVTDGPLRRVRHPLYAAVIGMNLACLCFFRTVALVPTVAVFIFLWYLTARYEEYALSRKFGARYAAYRARTGMFLPPLKQRADG